MSSRDLYSRSLSPDDRVNNMFRKVSISSSSGYTSPYDTLFGNNISHQGCPHLMLKKGMSSKYYDHYHHSKTNHSNITDDEDSKDLDYKYHDFDIYDDQSDSISITSTSSSFYPFDDSDDDDNDHATNKDGEQSNPSSSSSHPKEIVMPSQSRGRSQQTRFESSRKQAP